MQVRAELQRLQQSGIVHAAVSRLEQQAQQAKAEEDGQHAHKHPAAERRKQRRAAARAQLRSDYEQQCTAAEAAGQAEPAPLELAHEVKLAAAEAAIRAALQPAAAPLAEQALLRASLLGEELPVEPQLADNLGSWAAIQPTVEAAQLLPQAEAAEAAEAEAGDEPLGHWQELELEQLAMDAAQAAAVEEAAAAEAALAATAQEAPVAEPQPQLVAAVAAERAPAGSPLRAALAAAEGGLRRVSTSRDGSLCYSFAASPCLDSGGQAAGPLSARQLAVAHLLPQMAPEVAAGLSRQLARLGTHLPLVAAHLEQAAGAAQAGAELASGVAVVSSEQERVHNPCPESVALAAKLAELRAELAAEAAYVVGAAAAAPAARAAPAALAAEPAEADAEQLVAAAEEEEEAAAPVEATVAVASEAKREAAPDSAAATARARAAAKNPSLPGEVRVAVALPGGNRAVCLPTCLA